MCLGNSMKKAKTAAAATKRTIRKQRTEQHEGWKQKTKWQAEAKTCAARLMKRKTTKRENKKQRHHVYRATKNMRSMHSSERIKEMVCELEGYRWDAILLNETWRPDKSEIWETHHKHIFIEARKYDSKHGVGIMLNKKWRHRIIDTEYTNERAITATIVANNQRIKLMSVYFLHSGYVDHHFENLQNDREAHDKLQKIHTDCWRRLQCRTGTW